MSDAPICIRAINDFAFRRLFGAEDNKDILIAFLNAIVRPAVPITDVVIKNPFNLADYDGGKETIVDIKAQDENGHWYDIEVQLYPHAGYGKRGLFYGAKIYVDQFESGADYTELKPTICIHILDFEYFKNDDRVFRHLVYKDAETNEVHPDFLDLQFRFVELPKFDKEWSDIGSADECWAAFLKHSADLDSVNLPAALRAEPAIVRAVSALERIGYDSKQRAIYDRQEEKHVLEAGQIRYAEQQAEQRGRQEGRQDLLVRQMTRHIGAVPAHVMARLNGLSADELNDLGEALFDLTSYDDIEAWFTRH